MMKTMAGLLRTLLLLSILLLIHVPSTWQRQLDAVGCLDPSANISFSCPERQYMRIKGVRVAVTNQKTPSFCSAPFLDDSHCGAVAADAARNIVMECHTHASCNKRVEASMEHGVLADCPETFTGDKYISVSYYCDIKDGVYLNLSPDPGPQLYGDGNYYLKSPNYGKLWVDSDVSCELTFLPSYYEDKDQFTFRIQAIDGYSTVLNKDDDNVTQSADCAFQVNIERSWRNSNAPPTLYRQCANNDRLLLLDDPVVSKEPNSDAPNGMRLHLQHVYGSLPHGAIPAGRVLLQLQVGIGDTSSFRFGDGFLNVTCTLKDVTPPPTTTTPATTTVATTTVATTTAATIATTAATTAAATTTAATAAAVSSTEPRSRVSYAVSTVASTPATSSVTYHSKTSSQPPLDKHMDDGSNKHEENGMLHSTFVYYIVGAGVAVGLLLVAAIVTAFFIKHPHKHVEEVAFVDLSPDPDASGEENQSQSRS